ncbi:MAG: hypothetical protein ACF8PN_15880 [Phycisphaerales bacterium]
MEPISTTTKSRGAELLSRLLAPDALVLSAVSVSILAVGALVSPRLLQGAVSSDAANESELSPARQEQMRLFDGVLSSMAHTVAVETFEDGAVESIVLLQHTVSGADRLNPREALVLQFSPLLQSVRAYTIDENADSTDGPGHRVMDIGPEWTRSFMSHRDTVARVILVDVRDMRIVTNPPEHDDSSSITPGSTGWIELTWVPESADRPAKTVASSPLPPAPAFR